MRSNLCANLDKADWLTEVFLQIQTFPPATLNLYHQAAFLRKTNPIFQLKDDFLLDALKMELIRSQCSRLKDDLLLLNGRLLEIQSLEPRLLIRGVWRMRFAVIFLFFVVAYAQDEGLEPRLIFRDSALQSLELAHQQGRYAILESQSEKRAIRQGDQIGREGFVFLAQSEQGLWLKTSSGFALFGKHPTSGQTQIQFLNPTEVPQWLRDFELEDQKNEAPPSTESEQ